MNEEKTISFPHIGNYYVPITRLLRTLFPRHNIMPAPKMTKHTLELGCRLSPDIVCSPFKYTAGNYIEALEAGANVLLQTGMGCLFGYYGEVQEQILRDAGYNFEFICFSRDKAKPAAVYSEIRRLGCTLGLAGIASALRTAISSIKLMDRLEYYMRENIGFELIPGSMESLHSSFLDELSMADNMTKLRSVDRKYTAALHEIVLDKPESIMRIGVVGELYTLMEPFSNFYIERSLAAMGASVSRKMSATYLLFERSDKKSLQGAEQYLEYVIGANGVDSVAQALDYARLGYDGIIHMKAFGCTPEINAIPVLRNISADFKIPMLTLSFDSHTAETGLHTRLEAFMDMIIMASKRECS